MAVQGAFHFFNAAMLKINRGGGPVDLTNDAFKWVLCNSTQALGPTFVGASGDARYSDLTGELATAGGYTNGGLAMTGQSLIEDGSGNTVWDSDNILWVLTGSITFKYLACYDDTTPNKDLIVVTNMDTGGGSVTAVAGPLLFDIANIETLTQ